MIIVKKQSLPISGYVSLIKEGNEYYVQTKSGEFVNYVFGNIGYSKTRKKLVNFERANFLFEQAVKEDNMIFNTLSKNGRTK